MGNTDRIVKALKKLTPDELDRVAKEYVRRHGFPGMSADFLTAAAQLAPDFLSSTTVKQIIEIFRTR